MYKNNNSWKEKEVYFPVKCVIWNVILLRITLSLYAVAALKNKTENREGITWSVVWNNTRFYPMALLVYRLLYTSVFLFHSSCPQSYFPTSVKTWILRYIWKLWRGCGLEKQLHSSWTVSCWFYDRSTDFDTPIHSRGKYLSTFQPSC